MTTDEMILYFAVTAFDTEIIRRTMRIFFDAPRSKALCVIAYLLNYITAIFSHSIENIVVGIVINAITIGFISAQYNGAAKRKIIGSVVAFSLMYLCEFAAGIIFFEGSDNYLLNSGSPDLKALIASKLLNFTVVLILNRIRKGHDTLSVSVDWSAIALIPISTAVLELAVISSVRSIPIIILSVVIILFLNVTVFYLYDKLAENYIRGIELARVEQEKEIYFEQCAAAMRSQESLRKFRHDINNQLETMSVLLNNGDITELKNQIGDLLSSGAGICFSFTGNIVVDGILNYKLGKLKQCGVEIETDLEIPGQTFMNTNDLTIVLGNLLDNAIDALSAMRSDKYCFVQIKYRKSRLMICLKNTYENAVLYRDGRIISDKQDPDAHGIGLRNVRDIVDKYNGVMDISHRDRLFVVKLILTLPSDIKEE